MRTASSDFIEKQNALIGKPIWLYRAAIDDDPDHDLFLAAYHQDVEFFKDAATAQTYTAFPITHSDVRESNEGGENAPSLTIGNVSREIQAYLELYDGLRGRKVTIRQVDADLLDDSNAYYEQVFWIDSVVADETSATFRLSSRMDRLGRNLQRRHVARNHCECPYKKRGCWLADGAGGWEAAAGFVADKAPLYLARTVSDAVTGIGVLIAHVTFRPVDIYHLTKANGTLIIEIACDDPTKLTTDSQIEISSSGGEDSEEWSLTDITSLGITSGWQTFELALAAWGTSGGELDPTAINFLRIYSVTTGTATLQWRNAYIQIAGMDACDKTLRNCRLHGNARRYGGFPGVPKSKIIGI